jgi:hypothetical protein
MRKFRREQVHATTISDIIGEQNDGSNEGQQIAGDTAAAPVFPIGIISRRLELLYF